MEKVILNKFILIICIFLVQTQVYAKNIKVHSINFSGNYTFDSDDLSDLIYSHKNNEYDARLIKVDKILVTNFYREHGFLIVAISDSVVREDEYLVDIYYTIDEGQRYYYGRADISGAGEGAKIYIEDILSEIKPKTAFNEGTLNQYREKIENYYYDSGKPFAEIDMDYRFEEDSLVVVLINIKEKATVRVNDISYHGLRNVKSFIVRRELEFKQGDLYRRKEFSKSQENIYSTGLFDYVRFEIESKAKDSTSVNVHIHLREKDARWVGLRGGFAYDEVNAHGNKLELMAEGGHRNLFGTARSLSLHIVPSFSFDLQTGTFRNVENNLALVFVEPWIGYTRTPGIFRISYEQQRPESRTSYNLANASFGVSHQFENKIDMNAKLDIKRIDEFTESGTESGLTFRNNYGIAKGNIYSISYYSRLDARNDFFNPTDGSLTDFSISFSYGSGKASSGEIINNRYLKLISTKTDQRSVMIGYPSL